MKCGHDASIPAFVTWIGLARFSAKPHLGVDISVRLLKVLIEGSNVSDVIHRLALQHANSAVRFEMEPEAARTEIGIFPGLEDV